MKVKLRIRFPCGYQFEYELRVLPLFSSSSLDEHNLPICPIHKTKCKASN